MNRQLLSHSIQNALFHTWRRETVGDKSYLVVKGVPLVEGVLNSRLVKADEFGAFPKDWDGVPVVLRHPKQNGGSARVPSTDVPVVGRFYNAAMDGARLVGEFWLDENILQLSDEGQALVTKVTNQHPVEVSTGYFAESIPQIGVWNKKEYNLVDQNLHPDHIALLPDEVGACSLEDGCGLNRNSETPKESMFSDAIQNVTGLKGEAAKMWEKIYRSAMVQYDDEAKAAATAWAAIKEKYKKNKDGEWVLKENTQDDLGIPPYELEGLASLVAFVSE